MGLVMATQDRPQALGREAAGRCEGWRGGGGREGREGCDPMTLPLLHPAQ